MVYHDFTCLLLPLFSALPLRVFRPSPPFKATIFTRASSPKPWSTAAAYQRHKPLLNTAVRTFSASSFFQRRRLQSAARPDVGPHIEVFKRLVADDKATQKHARGCLLLHQAEIQALPKTEQKSRAEQLDIVGRR